MKPARKDCYSYVLVAAFICLVVNFSYLLLLVVSQDDGYSRGAGRREGAAPVVEERTGRLSLSVDGYGYIIDGTDSIYVDRGAVRRHELKNGDTLKVEASNRPRREGSHLIMKKVITCNGEPFDYGAIYNGTSRFAGTMFQILYYFAVSFVLLLVMNMRHGGAADWTTFIKRGVTCTAITVAAYFLAPVTMHFSGETVCVYKCPHALDFVVMMKCVFMLVLVLLYSRIYVLMSQRRQVELENEQLKNENLTTRYNMLVSQINPHFFFNSLNSLSMLVREGDGKRALEYIEQLSYTFRYITQTGSGNTLVTLREELQFAQAYCYLFRIRYADKMFFDIDVAEEFMEWRLPALSLQPLIGNAVKHNAITNKNPLRVRIFVEDGYLTVSNPRRPMLEPQIGTGTGLKNLGSRYKLLLGRDVEVVAGVKEFVVRLPLQKNTDRV